MLRNELLYPTATTMFLEDNVGTIRTPASRKTYRDRLASLQRMYPGRRVSQFTEADLLAWVQGGDPSPNTIHNRKMAATTFFGWAAWKGLTKRDPSLGLKRLVREKIRNVRTGNWLNEEQVRRVLLSIPLDDFVGLRDRALLQTGFSTGLRRFELEALRWGSFDERLTTFTVVGKGDKPATLGVPAQLRELLEKYRAEFPSTDAPLFPATFRSGWSMQEFNVRWDRGLGRQGLADVVNARSKAALGFGIDPHDMRRSFAGILEAKGVDIRDIQKALRHDSVVTTERYLEKNPSRAIQVGAGFTLDL